jgi:hypothetical protein
MSRNVFLGIFTSNHSRGEDGVSWGETCGNSEGREEVKFGNKGIDEPSGNEPPLRKRSGSKEAKEGNFTYVSHDGNEKEG